MFVRKLTPLSEFRDAKAGALLPQQSALMTPQRLHKDSTRGAGPEKRHDLLTSLVLRCARLAGRSQLSAWRKCATMAGTAISSTTVAADGHLASSAQDLSETPSQPAAVPQLAARGSHDLKVRSSIRTAGDRLERVPPAQLRPTRSWAPP